MDYLQERGPCVFISIEAGRTPEAERRVRDIARRVKNVVALHQRRAGMKKLVYLTVFEALGRDKLPKFGAHIVAHLPTAALRDKLIASLNTSKAFAGHLDVGDVYEFSGLTGYLLKEGTQQARWRKGYRTVGGSIPLGELGGDRVILSPHLRDTLFELGRIEPYQRTNAKRQATARRKGSSMLPPAPTAAPSESSASNVIVTAFGATRHSVEPKQLAAAA
jgi:hypothetical protein